MSLYVFNNQQKVTKVIKYKRLVEATQEIELNGTDELTVEIPNKDWNKLEEEPLYLAVRDTSKRFSFHMYKILQEDTQGDTVTVKGIQIGYDEMKAYGYIKDRRFTQASMQSVANVIVEGTDWQTGFVDSDLPAITTNFYYISRLEAIRKVIEANGCEIRFRVEITGNKIVAKRIDFLKRMSSDKGKRFSYGSKLLSVVKEKDSAELYTALVGRGKGEEVGDGYGRRIGFEDIEWNVANGDPVDKPLGQEFVELPDMTALYGYPDGEPRTNVVTFEDTEDEALLLEQTYEKLVEVSRPQVQFKATVQLIGDAELGETVSIIRHDLNFKYKTRIFKVKRDLLNNNRTEIELGDRITESLGRTIRRIDTTSQRREERIVEYVQNTADGKNKIFRQASTPDTGMTVNDLWYKPVGEGETELYRWNGNIWQLEKVSAGLLGGTLDAENGDVNLINVNVASIVGETAEFVKANFNSATGGRTIIDGDAVKVRSHLGEYSKLEEGGVWFYTKEDVLNGSIESSYYARGGTYTGETGVGIFIKPGRKFSLIRDIDGVESNVTILDVPTDKDELRLRRDMDAYGRNIYGANTVGTRNDTNASVLRTWSTGEAFVGGSNGTRLGYIDGTTYQSRITIPKSGSVELYADVDMRNKYLYNVREFVDNDGHYFTVSGSRKLDINSSGLVMHSTLNMNTYGIINQSDIRLKKNIKPTKVNALREIDRLEYIDYEWDVEKKPEAPDGDQFGVKAQYAPFLQTKADGEDSYLSIDYMKYINLVGKGVQELLRRVELLERGNSDD